MSEKNCENCGNNNPSESKFCSNCGCDLEGLKRFSREQMKKRASDLLKASGIIFIVGSICVLASGLYGFYRLISVFPSGFEVIMTRTMLSEIIIFQILGIMGVLSFFMGLTSGVLCLKRKYIYLSILGGIILVSVGSVNALPLILGLKEGLLNLLFFSIPLLAMSIFSLIVCGLKRKEFC